MRVILHLIGVVALGASVVLPCHAGEFAVLGNGFRMHADRHETVGNTVRLYEGGGVAEIPAASVMSFEREEVTSAPAAPHATKLPAVPVPAVTPDSQANPRDLAVQAARKFSLPEAFIASVMRSESAFRQSAVSPKGAIGLMQLMPDTAKKLGVDPKDPRQNAEGGAQYLRELLARYEESPNQVLLALAAYNAGPEAVERYHGVPPYPETRQYILRILKNWNDSGKK